MGSIQTSPNGKTVCMYNRKGTVLDRSSRRSSVDTPWTSWPFLTFHLLFVTQIVVRCSCVVSLVTLLSGTVRWLTSGRNLLYVIRSGDSKWYKKFDLFLDGPTSQPTLGVFFPLSLNSDAPTRPWNLWLINFCR